MFKPIFEQVHSMIMNHMREMKTTESEFVGTLGIIFWNERKLQKIIFCFTAAAFNE